MKGFAGTVLIGLAALVLTSVAPAVAALPLGPAASISGDPTPGADNAIRAVYATRVLDDLEGFEVNVDLVVFEFALPPLGGQSAAEIRAAPEPVRALFEASIHDTILNEAQRVLPNAKVSLEALGFEYGIDDHDGDAYHPGIHIQATLRALFTPAFFDLPGGAKTPPADVARAFLYSGGVYTLARDIQVPAGFDVVHTVDVPEFLEVNALKQASQARIEFHKDNFDGDAPGTVRLAFSIRLRDGGVPANVLAGPLVKASFVVDDATPTWKQVVPFLGGDYVGHLDLNIQVHSLDASLFANYPLPKDLALPQVSADLLRVALQEKIVSTGDVESFFDGLVRRSLEEGFGPKVDLRFDWEAFERSIMAPIGGPDGKTVVPLTVRAYAVLPFESNKMFVSSSLGRLFGMTVGMNGGFALDNDGMWNAEYTVAYPEGVHVDVTDSSHLTQNRLWGARDGFTVALPRGSETEVHVSGRSDFHPGVFLAGLVQLAAVGFVLWYLSRKVQELVRGRRAAHFIA